MFATTGAVSRGRRDMLRFLATANMEILHARRLILGRSAVRITVIFLGRKNTAGWYGTRSSLVLCSATLAITKSGLPTNPGIGATVGSSIARYEKRRSKRSGVLFTLWFRCAPVVGSGVLFFR